MGPRSWTNSQLPQEHRSPLSRVPQAGERSSDSHPGAEQNVPHPLASTGLTPVVWKIGHQPTKVSPTWGDPRPDEGFTTVTRSRSVRKGGTNITDDKQSVLASPLYRLSDRGGRLSRFGPSAPNAGAGGRPGQNAPHTSSGFSHYRQSALPVEERDPILVEVEQNKGRKIAKQLYKPGMIVRAIVHEPHFNAAANVVDPNKTQSIFGPIYSKYRKMIVIALYEDHYVAIPLYTHSGNGLVRKNKPEEYVSVKDHRSTAPFINLSTHQPLVTGMLNQGIEPYEAASAAHLTYPVCRSYDLPIVQEGHLTPASHSYLLQLYIKYVPKA